MHYGFIHRENNPGMACMDRPGGDLYDDTSCPTHDHDYGGSLVLYPFDSEPRSSAHCRYWSDCRSLSVVLGIPRFPFSLCRLGFKGLKAGQTGNGCPEVAMESCLSHKLVNHVHVRHVLVLRLFDGVPVRFVQLEHTNPS